MHDEFRLIPFDEFLQLEKGRRRQYLQIARMNYPDKQLRDLWDVKYATWYYHLTQLGLAGHDSDDQLTNDIPTGKRGRGRPAGVKNKATRNSPPMRKVVPPNEVINNFIDAEYTVVEEPHRFYNKSTAVMATPPETRTYMSFDIEDEPQNIHERLNAIAMLLKYEKSNLRLKIEVYKV